jgi:arsenate reductase (thioredoxin)
MKRVLVLCTHNSARSQMAEGLLRYVATQKKLELDIYSAGTEKTKVKADAITVMREVGIDISSHTSKTLYEVPDP